MKDFTELRGAARLARLKAQADELARSHARLRLSILAAHPDLSPPVFEQLAAELGNPLRGAA